jgi:tetratricopeptide (TPR) repeat protein
MDVISKILLMKWSYVSLRLSILKIPGRRFPSQLALLALFFLFSGCGADKNSEDALELLYRQAYASSRSHDYLNALDCFNKALALDTLKTASVRVVRALNEKRIIEGLTGEYEEAFKSTGRLEKLPAGILPDSLRNQVFSDQATWLRELGNYTAAASALEKITAPSIPLQLELASLYRQSADYTKAAAIYHKFTGTDSDPVTRITAYAGLLCCKVADPQLVVESADIIAGKIAAESAKVFALKTEPEARVQALRAASKSLQLLEKQQRNASYLLFRALILAEESRNQLLLQVVRLESNAVIVRKAVTSTEVADYFRMNNMQYAQAVSLFMLAGSETLEASQRIAALQMGFAAARDFAPPYPPADFAQLEKNAGRRLNGLLLEKSRIFDLFDAAEVTGMLDLQRSLQQHPDSFILGKGHEALQTRVRRLQREISGLLQRKADIFLRAEGYEKNKVADQALNIKKGKMQELQAEVRAINPAAAEIMQLLPVTLRTVQNTLKDDQAILKPLLSDSLCGVMIISKRQLEIAPSPLAFDSLHTPASGIRALHNELLASSSGFRQQRAEEAWFAKVFYEPLAMSQRGTRHFVVIADDLFPYPILERSYQSFPEKKYSIVRSIKEFALLSANPEPLPVASQIYFYQADHIDGARMHKLFAPRDRVFLLWKNFSPGELETLRRQIGKEMQGTVSGSSALFELGQASAEGWGPWGYISSYGVD